MAHIRDYNGLPPREYNGPYTLISARPIISNELRTELAAGIMLDMPEFSHTGGVDRMINDPLFRGLHDRFNLVFRPIEYVWPDKNIEVSIRKEGYALDNIDRFIENKAVFQARFIEIFINRINMPILDLYTLSDKTGLLYTVEHYEFRWDAYSHRMVLNISFSSITGMGSKDERIVDPPISVVKNIEDLYKSKAMLTDTEIQEIITTNPTLDNE